MKFKKLSLILSLFFALIISFQTFETENFIDNNPNKEIFTTKKSNTSAIKRLKQILAKGREKYKKQAQIKMANKKMSERKLNLKNFKSTFQKNVENVANFEILSSQRKNNKNHKNTSTFTHSFEYRKLKTNTQSIDNKRDLENVDLKLPISPSDQNEDENNPRTSFIMNYKLLVSKFDLKIAIGQVDTLSEELKICMKEIKEEIIYRENKEINFSFLKFLEEINMKFYFCFVKVRKLMKVLGGINKWSYHVVYESILSDTNAIKYLSKLDVNLADGISDINRIKQTISMSAFYDYMKENKDLFNIHDYIAYYKGQVQNLTRSRLSFKSDVIIFFMNIFKNQNLKNQICKIDLFINFFNKMDQINDKKSPQSIAGLMSFLKGEEDLKKKTKETKLQRQINQPDNYFKYVFRVLSKSDFEQSKNNNLIEQNEKPERLLKVDQIDDKISELLSTKSSQISEKKLKKVKNSSNSQGFRKIKEKSVKKAGFVDNLEKNHELLDSMKIEQSL